MLKLIVLATVGGYRCAAAVLRADQQAYWSEMGNPPDVIVCDVRCKCSIKCMLAVWVCRFVSVFLFYFFFGGYFLVVITVLVAEVSASVCPLLSSSSGCLLFRLSFIIFLLLLLLSLCFVLWDANPGLHLSKPS